MLELPVKRDIALVSCALPTTFGHIGVMYMYVDMYQRSYLYLGFCDYHFHNRKSRVLIKSSRMGNTEYTLFLY